MKTELQVENFNKDMENDAFTDSAKQNPHTETNMEENAIYSSGRAKKTKKEKMNLLQEISSWFFAFGFAVIAALLIKNYLIINANVPTGSMENTIMPGDRMIGNRLAYLNADPKRGDIVIFEYPDNEEDIYVKRIIGLPGEIVVIADAQIFIDNSSQPLEEDYLKETWTTATGPYIFEVPEECYLVLGDNRNDSWDARYWTNTYVKKEQILGKALFTYWPLQDAGKLE